MSRCLPKLITFFYGFLIDFGSQLRPPEPSKSWFFYGKTRFSKNCLSKLRMIFDTILVPTWLHFASPNPPKSFQKSIPRCTHFLIDFCIDFVRFWLHLGAQVEAMLATFSAKNGGSVACSRPFCCDGVFSPLFGPPGHLMDPSWGPFWQVFGFILAQFWRTSWPFLGSFSKPGAHTNPKLLDGSLCRRPSACRTRGGGNAACRAKDICVFY